jgi:hypothetical protein
MSAWSAHTATIDPRHKVTNQAHRLTMERRNDVVGRLAVSRLRLDGDPNPPALLFQKKAFCSTAF